jgi:hypothetical protein
MQIPALASRVLTSPWPVIGGWWVGGLLAIFVPIRKWYANKATYYSAYGKYVEYENKQRAYNEAQNGNNSNQYNNGNQQYRSLNCNWWQYKCRKMQYYYQQMRNNNGQDNSQYRTPNWYQFLGGVNEEENRDERQMDGVSADAANGPVKFVYVWSIFIFVALLFLGTYTLYKKKSFGYLAFSLAVVTQYSLLMLLLLPQGVINTDDRDLEEAVYGWYGQLSVLMVYFYFAQVLFGGVSLMLIGGQAAFERYFHGKKSLLSKEVDPSETTSGYQSAAVLDVA